MTASATRLEKAPPTDSSVGTLGRLLVATDGRPGANPALTAAKLLAERGGADVEVISVLEPMPVLAADLGIVPPVAMEQARREAMTTSVDAQLRLIGRREWRTMLNYGSPPQMIARTAERRGVRMIIMGLGRHNLVDRLVGSETALQVLRLSSVPVLAVAPGFSGPPRRVVMGLDFSAGSLRAAREALAILAPHATIYLVHVSPRVELPPGGAAAWEISGEEVIEHTFGRAIDEIGFPEELTVETMSMRGDPAGEILAVAAAVEADLIVVGSHGHGFFERMLIGSVASKVLRGSTCSVFAVPPLTDELEGDGTRAPVEPERTLAREEWAERLDEFSRWNAGRTCTVEEDDEEFGAQMQGRGYRLVGAAYDRHDERVELVLAGEGGSHLTRNIPRPRAVQILAGPDGRDRTIRVAHDKGQTLLTFTS